MRPVALEDVYIRLYLDHHIKQYLAVDLRAQGYDVLTSQEAGMSKAADDAQLNFAAAERRALLTYNIGDFARLHTAWLAEGRVHAGIIVCQQLGSRQYGTLLQWTHNLLDRMTRDEISGLLVHLEQFRS